MSEVPAFDRTSFHFCLCSYDLAVPLVIDVVCVIADAVVGLCCFAITKKL